MSSLGAGVKVVILDSGVEEDEFIKPVGVMNFTRMPISKGARHGTDMAAIISSRDPLCLGIAPGCLLYVAKVFSYSRIDWSHYELALDWALEIGADVVNMSFGVSRLSGRFEEKLKLLDQRGTICLAAHSQFSAFRNNSNILTVGRLAPHSTAEAVATDVMTRRASNGSFRPVAGSSVSTAVMSGIAACVKAVSPGVDRSIFLNVLSDN